MAFSGRIQQGGNYSILDVGDAGQAASMRNFSVHGHDYYYTVEKKLRVFDYNPTFDDAVNVDQTLILYHQSPFTMEPVKMTEFDARVIFELLEGSTRFSTNVTQNNKSVKFDASTMYYFNKKGVFSYGLLDGKTKKLSSIQAKDMKLTVTSVEIIDLNGKRTFIEKMNRFRQASRGGVPAFFGGIGCQAIFAQALKRGRQSL